MSSSFDDFSDNEKLVRFLRRVRERLIGGEARSRLVFAEDIKHRDGVRGGFNVTDIDFAQFFRVLQNVGQLFLEKLRLLLAQIEPGEFLHVADVEISALSHGLEMEMVEQPNRRDQKRNHQNQKKNAPFAALFPQRSARFRRYARAVTLIVQRH